MDFDKQRKSLAQNSGENKNKKPRGTKIHTVISFFQLSKYYQHEILGEPCDCAHDFKLPISMSSVIRVQQEARSWAMLFPV